MELFLQFVSLHWHLFGLLSLLVAALVFYENRKAGPTVGNPELSKLLNKENGLVLDVRPKNEYSEGHIAGALNIPVQSFETRQAELEKHKERPIIVVCNYGQSAGGIAKKLLAQGYNVCRLRGGMVEWSGSNLPTVRA